MLLTTYAAKPLKWLWVGMIYTVVGAVILFCFNLIGTRWGVNLPINLATAFVAGVLGLPGLVCLILVKWWIVGA